MKKRKQSAVPEKEIAAAPKRGKVVASARPRTAITKVRPQQQQQVEPRQEQQVPQQQQKSPQLQQNSPQLDIEAMAIQQGSEQPAADDAPVEDFYAEPEPDLKLEEMKGLLLKLQKHPSADSFLRPVFEAVIDKKYLKRYKEHVQRPMDLRTIQNKLAGNGYESHQECAADINQVWANVYIANGRASEVGTRAGEMERLFTHLYRRIEPRKIKLEDTEAEPEPHQVEPQQAEQPNAASMQLELPESINNQQAALSAVLVPLGLEHLSSRLAGEEIDRNALQLMSDGDLVEIGIPKGPRMKLCKWISQQRKDKPQSRESCLAAVAAAISKCVQAGVPKERVDAASQGIYTPPELD